MYSDILVPTDGSDSIEQVLEHTIDIADGRNVTVHALYVVDDRAFLSMDDDMQDEVLEELKAEGRAATSDVAAALEQEGLSVTKTIRRGRPADHIVSYVEEAGIDLVTMGSQAGEYEQNMLGSTSQKVVTQSPAPVLTVDVSDASE
ncbi:MULTISPECIES: universal stress protein [Halomicrobium]|uniref:Universal stress protein n=1 Tax=Halomicrobium mukohataei TaxID=57705 RepID=A0A847UE03_9EURY|nr:MULTISPECIES: universal stress protein [Halomicrobium]MBO4248701.1 universal stress protein [Halomicrobium sp. IBSBa]NLV09634.1 universal stress protein [Halomicrobium mukohataei]QGA81586.1 Nucleotide-binding protein, UspA family [Halomicrobium sp. LC1Hm]